MKLVIYFGIMLICVCFAMANNQTGHNGYWWYDTMTTGSGFGDYITTGTWENSASGAGPTTDNQNLILHNKFRADDTNITVEFDWVAAGSSLYGFCPTPNYNQESCITIKLDDVNNRIETNNQDNGWDNVAYTFSTGNTYHIKLILDSVSNTVKVYENNNLKITSDAEDFNISNILTYGFYYIENAAWILNFKINGTSLLNINKGDITILLKDEASLNSITQLMYIDYIGFNNGQLSTSSGTVDLYSISPGNYELRNGNLLYPKRTYFLDVIPGENNNITLYNYLLNQTEELDVLIRDYSLSGIENATIVLQRWYASEGIGQTVSMGKTNALGVSRFYVDSINYPYYKIFVSVNGTTIFSTNWEQIYSSSYRITTNYQSLYTSYGVLDGDITLDNSSLPYIFSLVYNNKHTDISQVCLKTYLESVNGKLSLYNSTCTSSVSGTIIHPINENSSYIAKGYYNISGKQVFFASKPYKALTAYQEDIKEMGLIITIVIFLVIVLGTLYIAKNAIAPIIAADIVVLAAWKMGTFPFSTWSLGLIIPGSIVIMYYLNKMV